MINDKQIRKMIGDSVHTTDPTDVLHKCDSETLMYISQMIKMGKGSNISFGEPFVRGRQIQCMNLVLTYDNMDDPSNCR